MDYWKQFWSAHSSSYAFLNCWSGRSCISTCLGHTLVIEAEPFPSGEVLNVGVVVATWCTAWMDHDGEQLIHKGSSPTPRAPGSVAFIIVRTATAHIDAFILFLLWDKENVKSDIVSQEYIA